MRFLLLLTIIASFILCATCTTDVNIDNLLRQIFSKTSYKSTGTELNLTPPTDNVDSEWSKEEMKPDKFDLTPTDHDNTVYCITRYAERGVCVFYYDCNNNIKNSTVDESAAPPVVSMNTCPHYLQVCCNMHNIQNNSDLTRENSKSTSNVDIEESLKLNVDEEMSTEHSIVETTLKPDIIIANISEESNASICGWSNPGAAFYLFNDTDAEKNYPDTLYGDFTWMVAILRKSGNNTVWSQDDYLGGGTLIHPSVVMTVAHKLEKKHNNNIYEANELKCRAGEWDTQTELELFEHQERDLVKIVVHEKYNRTSRSNNIALLLVKRPFVTKYTPNVGFGCLASLLPPPSRMCYTMGWEIFEPNEKSKHANVLKKIHLQIVEHDTCERMLKENPKHGPLFELHESLTCANESVEVVTCREDGGAPLVCALSDSPIERRFAVYGMVAHDSKCYDPNDPGVYTNTVVLRSWIDATMQKEGLDSNYYTI